MVVGGSYGGLGAAFALARQADGHRVTLMSGTDRFVYRPSLPHVAVGLREPGKVGRPLAPALARRNLEFVHDAAQEIDPEKRRVVGRKGEYRYDFLVLAPGVDPDWSALPGAPERMHTLLWMDDAVRLREAIARFNGGAVVVGVQREGAVLCPVYELPLLLDAELARRGLRGRTTIQVYSYEETPLALGGPSTSARAAEVLRRRRIGFVGGTQATRVEPDRVRLEHGAELEADLLVIIPAYRGKPVVKGLGGLRKDGMVPVDDHLRHSRYEEVYVVGDTVASDGPKTGRMAQQQGRAAAANILAALQGRRPCARYTSEYLCLLDLGAGGGLGFVRRPSPGRGRPKTYLSLSGRPLSWAKTLLERYHLSRLGPGG